MTSVDDFEDGRLTIRRSGNVDFNLFRVWIMGIAVSSIRNAICCRLRALLQGCVLLIRGKRLLCHDARKYVRNRVGKSEKNRHA